MPRLVAAMQLTPMKTTGPVAAEALRREDGLLRTPTLDKS